MALAIERMRVNGFKLKERQKEEIFVMRAVRRWSGLPREVVGAPSLEVFRARLDGALGGLVWRETSLPVAGDLDEMDFKSPFSTQTIL